MAITKLNLVNVDFNKDCYNSVLLKLYNHDDFHPELASKFTDSVAGLTVYNKDNLYEELLVRIQEMTEKYHFQAQTVKTESNQLNVVKVKEFLDDLFLDIDRIDAVKEQLLAMIKENDDAIVQLRHVAGLDVNFDDLFSCQYLQVRFGKIPNSNVGKLEFYESLPFVYKSFEMDERYTWCMYITTPGDAPEVDNVFTSLYFERIHIPEFIHGEADLAIAEIQDETNSAKEHSVQLQKRIDKIISDNIDEVNRIYTIASELNSVYIMQKYIVVMGDKLTVTGFVPAKKVDAFKNDFESIGNVHVEVLPAT